MGYIKKHNLIGCGQDWTRDLSISSHPLCHLSYRASVLSSNIFTIFLPVTIRQGVDLDSVFLNFLQNFSLQLRNFLLGEAIRFCNHGNDVHLEPFNKMKIWDTSNKCLTRGSSKLNLGANSIKFQHWAFNSHSKYSWDLKSTSLVCKWCNTQMGSKIQTKSSEFEWQVVVNFVRKSTRHPSASGLPVGIKILNCGFQVREKYFMGSPWKEGIVWLKVDKGHLC